MPLDFPFNPVNGQTYESYTYNSSTASWVARSNFASLSTRLTALESSVPSGTIHQSALAVAPEGYLFCLGQAVSRTQFSSLFSAIGTLYGTGDGSTTFNLPDLQGRVPVGRRADGTGTFAALNNRGGAEAVTLNLTQIPPHTHTQNSHSHSVSGSTNTTGDHNHRYNTNSSNAVFTTAGGTGMDRKLTPNNATTTTNGNHNHGFSGTTSAVAAENLNEGGSQPHNNLQPYIALNYIIKT